MYPGVDSNHLILAGGLASGQQSVNQTYQLNITSGSLHQLGSLPVSLHDAAYAKLGSQLTLFGGGASSSYNTAYTLSNLGLKVSTASMPQLRSDAVSVIVGNTAYVIGGYNGKTSDASVLKTKDGSHFINVGPLPAPVRYPAAAVSGKNIYVFGGETINGKSPISTVQIIMLTEFVDKVSKISGT